MTKKVEPIMPRGTGWNVRSAMGAALLISLAGAAGAQQQIKPRVMLMVDTSGSMLQRVSDNARTNGDGSTYYFDPSLTTGILTAYTGLGSTAAGCLASMACCPLTTDTGRGFDSRMANAKRAVANVINGSGDIEWGLMRYSALTLCPRLNTLTLQSPTKACNDDFDCNDDMFCLTRAVGSPATVCARPNNLCVQPNYGSNLYEYGRSTRAGVGAAATCNGGSDNLYVSYEGSCNTTRVASDARCKTLQTCLADADCANGTAGSCVTTGNVKACQCNGVGTCPGTYLCSNSPPAAGLTANRCYYNTQCKASNTIENILVNPAAGDASIAALPWVDGKEIWGAAGTGPTNPELRAVGFTPLAAAAREATAWYNGVAGDAQKACRPYITVLLTDGDDTCDTDANAGPVAAVQGFVAASASATNLNKVYVIGLNLTNALLDSMAHFGGTGTARLANNQADIEAALADIVASSVLYEQCNGLDDTCNGLVDEGLGVYEECVPLAACLAGACPASGRCPCTGGMAGQCDPGFTCNVAAGAGFCVPTCTVGVGQCLRNGVRKCGGTCCVNDGLPACTTLNAGMPGTEVCNSLDDNCNGQIDEGNVCQTCQPTVETCNGIDDDCNGTRDNNLVDTGLPCGTDEGECSVGMTACQPTMGVFPNATDRIVCVGGQGPVAEVCDGKDNNCDGVVDGMTRACFDKFTMVSGMFPGAMRNVGVCIDGQQNCNAVLGSGTASWDTCVGEIEPTTEVCNGKDDNCDGTTDNVAGTGGMCCTSGKCGVGICVAGTNRCSGGGIQCVGEVLPAQEICDGLDNDCNNMIDDVPGKGNACTPAGGTCGGHFVCNTTAHTLDCIPDAPSPEVCDGIDNDCDGLVDENDPDLNGNDSRINKDCDAPVAPADLPPCKPGKTACQNGQVVCNGAVTPQPNVCGEASRDCQTAGVFNGNCPSGFMCFEGTCAAPCGGGEFPCPGGFICKRDATSNLDFCVSDACTKITCPAGSFCHLDDQGMASCNDPCAGVTCPQSFRCREGLCVDDSCKTFGCPDGELCIGTECKPDPCFNVTCDAGQYCSPQTGNCVFACVGPCPNGEECIDGMCVSDPCSTTKCLAGQTCMVSSGVGVCVADICSGIGCNPGATCCGGACIEDPCAGVSCPAGATCVLTSACDPACVASASEKIVGAGGGGFACDVASVGGRPASEQGLWLLVAAAAWLVARRRRRTG